MLFRSIEVEQSTGEQPELNNDGLDEPTDDNPPAGVPQPTPTFQERSNPPEWEPPIPLPDFGPDPDFDDLPAASTRSSTPPTAYVVSSGPSMAAHADVQVETDVMVQERTAPYYMVRPPLQNPESLPKPNQQPRCITITILSCGEKNQDVNRIRRLHDILISRPGQDTFIFHIREKDRIFEIEFPNVTTGLTEPLIRLLEGMMGPNNIDIMYLE